MSKTILVAITDSKERMLIINELVKKYIDCNIDQPKEPVTVIKSYQDKKYDLIIVDNAMAFKLDQFNIDSINELFIYICPNFNQQRHKKLVVLETCKDVVRWIQSQSVNKEEILKKYQNESLINSKKTPSQEEKETKSHEKLKHINVEKDSRIHPSTDNENINELGTPLELDNEKESNVVDVKCPDQPLTKDNKIKKLDSNYFLQMYDNALQFAMSKGIVSVKMLINELKINYKDADLLVKRMEEKGVVGPYVEGKPRKVLIKGCSPESEKKVLIGEQSPLSETPLDEDESSYIGELVSNVAFANSNYDLHKTIGIWSPQGGRGTTTFLMNFAMYLGKNNYKVAAMEGVSNRNSLKLNLQRFSKIPDEWESYAKTLFKQGVNEKDALKVQWTFNNVDWYPLDDNDPSLEWTFNKLFNYINFVKHYKIGFVDFPGGFMDEYSKYTLNFMDELWIIMDNNICQMEEMKVYIDKLTKSGPERDEIPTKLICNHEFSFSKCDYYSKKLEIPLLSTIPDLSKETQLNLFDNSPLIKNPETMKKLKEPFEQIMAQFSIEKEEITPAKKIFKKLISILH